VEESLEMLSMARQDGISRIFATPHIIDGLFPNRGRRIITAVEELMCRLPAGVELFYGADVRITPDLTERMESGDILTLGGSRYLLIEFPEFVIPTNVEALIFELRLRRVTPVITHPERHLRLMHDFAALRGLRERGALCQVTALSITGGFGPEIQGATLAMIEKGLVDFVASDAHNTGTRPPVLSKAYAEVKKRFGEETAEMLFYENPGTILKHARRKD
jgi:protein-tyrosine phosphatase